MTTVSETENKDSELINHLKNKILGAEKLNKFFGYPNSAQDMVDDAIKQIDEAVRLNDEDKS